MENEFKDFFEGLSEEEAHDRILEIVGEYCDIYHNQDTGRPYEEGSRIPYAGRVYDREEMMNLVDSTMGLTLTMGQYTDEFEKGLGEFIGVPYVSVTNSGSSANLLSFMALTTYQLGDRAIKRGDEIITVAAGFPTTITPILNFGAVPAFVDVKIPEYNIDETKLEEAVSEKTKAVMLAHTLGNPFNVKAVRDFCRKYNLWLIEDNCDALGSRYFIDGEWRKTGSLGDIGTSSFYPAHHITMGEGGAAYTADPQLHKLLLSLRDWGRDCVCRSGQDNRCGRRFDGQYGALPHGYDHKYVYSTFGYNFRITEMQAAIGCAQLKKLPGFVEKRKENWRFLRENLADLSDRIILPEAEKDSDPSWFGFCMTLAEGIDRGRVIRYIEEHGVQTRMLFASNLIRHPCFDGIRDDGKSYRVVGELTNTDMIVERTFWVGVYPGMTEDRLSYMARIIREAVMR